MQLGGVKSCKLPTCNAEDWYNNSGAYEHGQEPRPGAVMCWKKGRAGYQDDGAGHVAIVEQVNPDGSVETSESNYGGVEWVTKTRKKPYRIAGQSFQGFIYNPFVKEEKKTNEEIAREVIAGKWGNGLTRRARLEAAGYDYQEVQNLVNTMTKSDKLDKVAEDVIAGKYGNGNVRRLRLQLAGYNYAKVQRRVNEILVERFKGK
jgi:hypothetical protein